MSRQEEEHYTRIMETFKAETVCTSDEISKYDFQSLKIEELLLEKIKLTNGEKVIDSQGYVNGDERLRIFFKPREVEKIVGDQYPYKKVFYRMIYNSEKLLGLFKGYINNLLKLCKNNPHLVDIVVINLNGDIASNLPVSLLDEMNRQDINVHTPINIRLQFILDNSTITHSKGGGKKKLTKKRTPTKKRKSTKKRRPTKRRIPTKRKPTKRR